jgi:hypothetical protein
MCRETIRRGASGPERSARERLVWESVEENHASFYESELAWSSSLRAKLRELA